MQYLVLNICRQHDGEKCTSDVRIPQNEKIEINKESNRNDGFDNFAIDPSVASRHGSLLIASLLL